MPDTIFSMTISDRRVTRRARNERLIHALWLALALVLSCMMAVTLVATDGSVGLGVALMVVYLVVALTVYRVEWGFAILFFAALFFDQHDVRYVMPFTSAVHYFANMNLIAGMPRYMIISLFEVHMAFVAFVWIVRTAMAKDYELIRLPVKVPAILGFSALALAAVEGVAKGADPIVMIWEIRALAYCGIFYAWTPQVIRTRQHLVMLIWVLIAGVAIKALQGGYFYAHNGFSFGVWPEIVETYTNHEDPVFMILLFMLLGAFLVLKVKTPQKTALLVLTVPLIIGFISGQRRATYASGMASMIGFLLLLPKKQLVPALKFLGVFLVVFTLYCTAFWNSYSRLGYVAQQLKSTITDEPGVRGSKDIESTLYRKAENFNLASTFRRVPVAGIGYGQAYDRPLRPWGGDFPLSEYIPHNQIFWIFVKSGAVGGFLFWFMFNSFVAQGGVVFRRLEDPYLQAVLPLGVISGVHKMGVSYVDMQLTFSRNMIVLGTLMGVLQILDRWSTASSTRQTTASITSY